MFVRDVREIRKPQVNIVLKIKWFPGKVVDAVKHLIQIGEMFISRAFTVLQIHTKHIGDQQASKGLVISLPNDVQIVADRLPRHLKNILVIECKFSGKDRKSQT